MVFALSYALGREQYVEVRSAIWSRTCPALDRTEHVSVQLAMMIPNCWVMEDSGNIIEDLLHRNVGVLPCIDYTWRDILENSGRDLTSRLVEDIGKVIF